MRCPRCDTLMDNYGDKCRFCGQNLKLANRVRRLSNAYYNMGLEKAGLRELSGACLLLQKSLEYDKENIDARNLLGLVYYELGEVVSAVKEWIISVNIQEEDNRASYYVDRIRNNPTELKNASNTARKYNGALEAAKNGNEDTAIIQLKNVVIMNPKFLRAQQLLALLYIHAEDYGKASKVLRRARTIDLNNLVTLRYMQLIGARFSGNDRETNQALKSYHQSKKDPMENVRPVGEYHEEKKRYFHLIYLFSGLIFGIVLSLVLIRPTIQGDKLSENTKNASEKNDTKVTYEARISSIQEKNRGLEKQIEGLKEDVKKEKKEKKKLESKQSQKVYELAKSSYNIRKYDMAEYILLEIIKTEPNNTDALFLLAENYYKMGMSDKAKEYYTKTISADKKSDAAKSAKARLAEFDMQTDSQTADSDTGEDNATDTDGE